MAKVKLKGMEKVMRNLQKEIKQIEGFTMKGLIRSVIIIRRDMDKTSPLIPVDTGNLRASFFSVAGRTFYQEPLPETTKKFKGEDAEQLSFDHSAAIQAAKAEVGSKLMVMFGFSANYATWAHEAVDYKFARPGSGAKFMESSIIRNKDRILLELKKSAKI